MFSLRHFSGNVKNNCGEKLEITRSKKARIHVKDDEILVGGKRRRKDLFERIIIMMHKMYLMAIYYICYM